MPHVRFEPHGVTGWFERGLPLLDAALQAGIPLEHECGGNCSCTTCHVFVEAGMRGLSVPEYPELECLGNVPGYCPSSRLACQALLGAGKIVVRIP